MKNKLFNNFLFSIFVIGVSLLIYFNLFHKIGLENINNDQIRWQTRTENFFKAFEAGKYQDTYQQYHPGVLFMYILKVGYISYELLQSNFNTWTELKGDNFIILNTYLKTANQITNLFLILLSTYIIYKLYGTKVAGVFGIFLINETYFIGILRNLHLDAGNALFIFSTVSLYLLYLKNQKLKYLILTGFFSGLGILFKSTTILSFFLIGLFSLIEIIKNFRNFKKYSISIIAIFFISIATFTILFPAMWTAPTKTLDKIFMEGLLGVGLSGDDNFNHHFNGTTVSDPGPYFYLNVLKFRTSNTLLLAFVICFFLAILCHFRKYKMQEIDSSFLYYYLLSAVIVLLINSYSTKKTDRYISTFFPFIILFISFYLVKYLSIFKQKIFYLIIILLISINVYFNYRIHPYYFAYYNPLIGGIRNAQNYLYINQGGIAYIEVLNYFRTIELTEKDKIGIFNKDEFIYPSNIQIYGLGPTDYLTKTYRIPTIQRGKDFLKKTSKVKTIYIDDFPFWEIYKAK